MDLDAPELTAPQPCNLLKRHLHPAFSGNPRNKSKFKMNNIKAAANLKELKEIYHQEGCYSFDEGIDSTIKALSDSIIQNDAFWERAASLYRTMAGSKSGFSDVYVDAGTSQERVAANIKLDSIRQYLWDAFARI